MAVGCRLPTRLTAGLAEPPSLKITESSLINVPGEPPLKFEETPLSQLFVVPLPTQVMVVGPVMFVTRFTCPAVNVLTEYVPRNGNAPRVKFAAVTDPPL